jgi:hypothetical protein
MQESKMSIRIAAAGCMALILMASTIRTAHAEHWVRSGPDSQIWYDEDSVRPTGTNLIGVWISSGPNRTNPGAEGKTIYPIYSMVDCRDKKAGSKISIDSGEPLQSFAPASGMGALITKLCS